MGRAYTPVMTATRRAVGLGGATAVVVAAVVLAAVLIPRPSAGPTAVVGTVDQFPRGSVTAVPFEVTVGPNPLISRSDGSRLYVVNHPEQGLLALWARNPHRGCTVAALALLDDPLEMPLEANAAFVNPCHGDQYALDGTWLFGPSPRGLDRFAIFVDAEGRVVVDVTGYEQGAPASP